MLNVEIMADEIAKLKSTIADMQENMQDLVENERTAYIEKQKFEVNNNDIKNQMELLLAQKSKLAIEILAKDKRIGTLEVNASAYSELSFSKRVGDELTIQMESITNKFTGSQKASEDLRKENERLNALAESLISEKKVLETEVGERQGECKDMISQTQGLSFKCDDLQRD